MNRIMAGGTDLTNQPALRASWTLSRSDLGTSPRRHHQSVWLRQAVLVTATTGTLAGSQELAAAQLQPYGPVGPA